MNSDERVSHLSETFCCVHTVKWQAENIQVKVKVGMSTINVSKNVVLLKYYC